MRRLPLLTGVLALVLYGSDPDMRLSAAPPDGLRNEAIAAMKKAAEYYHGQAALRGGYVYFYSADLSRRLGEGVASPDQVWVQPPGTPTVGLAYLAAWEATGDEFYRRAARDAATALIYGQLKSGGWTALVDFNPQSERAGLYRNGKGKGRNQSSLDDGTTQQALEFLIRADQAHQFRDAELHEAARIALDALLAAQFPNGAFPQGWAAPVSLQPIRQARYPDYDWRTENRIKEYWDLYTLNDDLCGSVSETLLVAHDVYGDERAKQALVRLGDFLILAQMPDPQPAWAQQYDYQMRPVWARKFEPPGISGRESQDAIATLLKIHRLTGDDKYLAPIPRAIAYLRKSQLPDGRLARYYELKTNRPLYMTSDYQLTYDDDDVPDHYGWKTEARLEELQQLVTARQSRQAEESRPIAAAEIRQILDALDPQGRWMSTYNGERLIGQSRFPRGEQYLSSERFSRHLEALSEFVKRDGEPKAGSRQQ